MNIYNFKIKEGLLKKNKVNNWGNIQKDATLLMYSLYYCPYYSYYSHYFFCFLNGICLC